MRRWRAAAGTFAAGMMLSWFTAPAEAACVVTGGGVQTGLQSGDTATCAGLGNTAVATASGASGVTVNVGDGSTPTVLDGAGLPGVKFLNATSSSIIVKNIAALSSNNTGILLTLSDNNTVAVNAGAVLGTGNAFGASSLGLDGSNNNTVNIGGGVGSLFFGTNAISIVNGSANNQVNILSGGTVLAADQPAILLGGAGNGNVINNAGKISSASSHAILGSINDDTVINSGVIKGNAFGVAVDLKGGNDLFELRAGSDITGQVLGGAGINTLRFGGAVDQTFDLSNFGPSGQFRQFDKLEKTGTSTWTLTGVTADASSLDIQAGTVLVNGSMFANVRVNGGVLGGTGTVGDVAVKSGGTLAPGLGTPGGALAISGSLAFQSGAIYLVHLDPSTASIAKVLTTATLTGGSVQTAFAAGSYAVRQYTILHAAGGLGGTTFSGVSGNVPAGFAESLSYTSRDVLLNLTAALGTLPGAGLNQNQRNVATSLNAFFNNGGTLTPNFVTVFGLTGRDLATALTQLSGEAATGAQQGALQFTGQFLGLMLDPFVDGRSGLGGGAGQAAFGFAPERASLPADVALAYDKAMKASAPAFEERWTAWGTAFGGYNKTSGDAVVGSQDLTARATGVAAGLDYHLGRNVVVGFALSGGGTKWDLANGIGGGKSDAFQGGVYTAVRSGAAYLAASIAAANHWMSTDRFAPLGDHPAAKFNAQTIGARIEGGYRFATSIVGVTPYAALQGQNFRTPSYSETDLTGGGFALAYNGRAAYDARSELGARFDRATMVAPNAALTLRARAAWAHDWVSDPSLAAAFQALPGASFIVNGATPTKNAALASAGAELKLANGVTLSAKFDGEFASRAQTYAGTGSLRYAW
ncbi:autotransporter domain-containing protein [Bradyrhizobium sp. GCM10023182]|uniref:Autotransporter domain-containing protein n=1 Tax=Bradyrhizobium zhengyangense TaxID=2911009 RepID=A0ABS9LHM6_9BRAD|nr:autotransporter outer membrane beta-barrel domain-containing protein [Bradyrhizobium zhengyangense]MCG2666478.1 autotransporter domain-containing protein [Bradyrhizobium zhengyangense]